MNHFVSATLHVQGHVINASLCCHVLSAPCCALDRCFACVFDNLLTRQQTTADAVDLRLLHAARM